jgi:diguanylate cyclase (GGDEF)-like protein
VGVPRRERGNESTGIEVGSLTTGVGRPTPSEASGTREAPRTLWRRSVLITAWVVLALGIGGSAAGGYSWARAQRTQSQRTFRDTAETLTHSVNSVLQRDLDFVATVRSMITSYPGLTNHALAPWIKSLDIATRYPGTMGFAYIVPVDAAALPSFAATMAADPVVGSAPGPFVVFPAGSRAQYCLTRLGYVTPNEPVSTGIDPCAPSSDGLASQATTYRQIAASGRPVISTVGALAKHLKLSPAETALIADLFTVTIPIYQGGAMPATSSARKAMFTGWLLGTFSEKRLLAPLLVGNPTLHVALRSANGAAIASTGPPVGRGSLSYSSTILTDPALIVVISGPASAAGLLQGVVLGSIGGALSVVLFLFLLHMTRSRERAFALVAERTGELRHQALHDPLTGLPNRALLFDRAEQMLRRSTRTVRSVGALYVDLDNFKDVNDSFGHPFGDRLLRAVAERLTATLRESDTVGRLGGDEFLVLVDGESFDIGPELVAERILLVMAAPFLIDGPTPVHLSVRVSIGVAVGLRASAEELIRDADVALYEAKAAGKDRFVVFRPEMQTVVQDRLGLEMDLREAVSRGDQLFLEYQPIFDLATMVPKGAEALVRWRHPKRGVMPPADFIPMAEQSGLILNVGRFVLRQACAQAASWLANDHPIGVSVNVSPRQLETPGFVAEVRGALTDAELEPGWLTLEITETSLMADTELTARVLRELQALGVHLSIDDFGTGYSSLAYLRQFPIDSLKIDRSFIRKVGRTGESNALVHTFIQLGKALGIETLAEGIEEEAQLDQLQREECDSGQGFLYARPLDAVKIEAFFAGASRSAAARRPRVRGAKNQLAEEPSPVLVDEPKRG